MDVSLVRIATLTTDAFMDSEESVISKKIKEVVTREELFQYFLNSLTKSKSSTLEVKCAMGLVEDFINQMAKGAKQ